MILQALYEYYQRKAANPESKMAPFGLEWKEIPFLIVVDENGKFIKREEEAGSVFSCCEGQTTLRERQLEDCKCVLGSLRLCIKATQNRLKKD